ncbi:hypothetical protein MKW92_044715 [Papaver armeniacum]|nr:hypothetical protein MKW92_044715 [Papaver armeniacum]
MLNMCSKCYKDSQAPLLTIDVNKLKDDSNSCDVIPTDSSVFTKKQCLNCNKRVKLVGGYYYHCGSFYCSMHRYPETHDCTNDYKSVGRIMVAMPNPLVKQDKLVERV